MKRVIAITIVALLLTGCTPEVKESKQESKQAIHKTENIQKNEPVNVYNPLSNDELAYLKTVEKSLETFTEKTTNVGTLMQQANDNPLIVKEDKWMNTLKGDFMTIALMGQVLSEMASDNVVPERFSNLHNNLQQSFELINEGGVMLVESIQNNLDMNMFNESMGIISQSNEKMSLVNAELNQITVEVNGK